MKHISFRFFCVCVVAALSVTGICIPAAGASLAELSKTRGVMSVSPPAPVDIHTSSGYAKSYPRELIANYSYAITATGTSFEISIHVIQSFAYVNVTKTTIFVNPEKPFTYSMAFDELGNDILTVKFKSQSPLGKFYLTVLQNFTVYSIRYTIDTARVGSYDKSSELYKLYTKPAPYIESDSAEIRGKSAEIVGGETNPYLAARKIQNFVVEHMTYDMSAVTPWKAQTEGALFALRSGKGVCRHFAALFTALARAAGIPTADIWGSRATSEGDVVDPGDRKHNWVHFYVPNYGWIPAEPTLEKGTGLNWFAQLQDNGDVPVMSVNYSYHRAWWSGGEAEAIVSREEPVISKSPTAITTMLPQEISWNVLSDGSLDLISEGQRIGGDLGQPYLDLANVAYEFPGGSLYFRFELRGQIPSQIGTTHIGSIWYQVLLDVDSDSSTGYLWSKDFTPDYILQLDSASGTITLHSGVRKYSGTGSDWSWTIFDLSTERFRGDAVLAGGIEHDFFVLSCRYGDISVSEGSRVRFFARSGVLYDGKVYNDFVPDESKVTVTLPSSAVTTKSSTTESEIATLSPSKSETSVFRENTTGYMYEFPAALAGLVALVIVVTYAVRARKRKVSHP